MVGRQLEQALGHASDAVTSREIDPVTVGLGQAPDQHSDQHEGRVRIVAQERAQLIPVQEPGFDVVDGDGTRGSAPPPSAAISPISSPGPRIASTTSRRSAP